jgi:hypothetical protein
MTTKLVTGGCFCGAVRYEASGAPLGSMICHCESCRRISGAPVVPWVTVSRDHFKIVTGVPVEFNSSHGVRRTHCAKCGTQLTYENDKSPTEIDIATCTLDDPNEFPPTHHSWLSDDLRWVRFGDGLPTFPQSRY